MRNIFLSLVALIVFTGLAYGQRAEYGNDDIVFTPKTLTAGTVMSARTDAAALQDTTRKIALSGFAKCYIALTIAANDSASAVVKYQGSVDGVNWSPTLVTIDSLSTSGDLLHSKGIALPDGGHAFEFVRFIIDGSDSALHSANPSTTIGFQVRLKHR